MSGSSIEHADLRRAGRRVRPHSDPARARAGRVDRAAKRAADVGLALTLLVLLAPVFVVCALAIKLDSRGPVFYRAQRLGLGGRELHVLKFRKMQHGARGHALTHCEDERFTRIGAFLARTRLDELPQLWNVLLGGMSFVGPRPEDAGFVALHRDAYERILSVRPGITGLCQLAFAKETEILDPNNRVTDYIERILPQKVGLDVLYAEQRTLRTDFSILIWTFLPVIVRRDVAVNRATGELTIRRRPGRSAAS